MASKKKRITMTQANDAIDALLSTSTRHRNPIAVLLYDFVMQASRDRVARVTEWRLYEVTWSNEAGGSRFVVRARSGREAREILAVHLYGPKTGIGRHKWFRSRIVPVGRGPAEVLFCESCE